MFTYISARNKIWSYLEFCFPGPCISPGQKGQGLEAKDEISSQLVRQLYSIYTQE